MPARNQRSKTGQFSILAHSFGGADGRFARDDNIKNRPLSVPVSAAKKTILA
jgi:hypothetical protein